MLSQHISDFLTSCRARRLSPRTIEWYGWLLGEYRDFVEERSLTWDQPVALDAFLSEVAARSSPHTLHGYYRALRRFFNWLEKRQVIADNPVRMIDPPRLPARQPQRITADAMIRLLETAAGEAWADRRDRAIILLLWDTGVRASELCHIRLSDIDMEQRIILLRNGKGGKDRWVAFGQATREALTAWLKVRGERENDFLFVGRYGEPLTRSGLSIMLRRRARQAGIRPVGAHAFRHGFAVAYLNNGGSIHNLRRLMGHATLRSTEVYLTIADREAIADHRRASPADHLE